MNNFEDVLGQLLARCEDNDAKRVLSAYDHSKTKPTNANHLASATFTKTMLEATIDVLKTHSTEFYPHATALIRSKMIARTKIQIAEDIVAVLYSITPTQCRACKNMYISTSAENTDANITCLLCGRRSHKECLNAYTIDNHVGVIFLCDPCLTNTETALVLDTDNAPQHNAAQQNLDNTPELEDVVVEDKDKDETEENGRKPENDRRPKPSSDEICHLYKTNSCPHGLTGKRHINGEPCKGKHPLKCFYHTGKYGTNGCRYSAARCPYFHPQLCENSTKLKMCLNKQCTKYHLYGTNRSMPRNTPPQTTRRDNPQPLRPVQSIPPNTQPHMWNTQQRPQSPQTTSHIQSPQNHDNGGRDSFLTYLEQMKADMHKQQAEMHQKMKSDLERSMVELLRESMQKKAQAEQSAQANHPVNPQPLNQMQMQPNLQSYQHMYPMLIPSHG